MSYYIKDQVVYTVPSDFEVVEKLPVANYMIKYDQKGMCFFLEKQKDFTLPDKIYGDVDKDAEKYLNTFSHSSSNMGVLLKGLKGTGKTLLAKNTCIKSNKPVLQLADSFMGSEFLSFMSSIQDDCIVLCDEFEKVYGYDNENGGSKQEHLLSLLDGTVSGGKKLFILTANDGEIYDALLNRPGRIRYFKEFFGLEKEVIFEMLNDRLVDKTVTKEIIKELAVIRDITPDILTSVAEEHNLYGKDTSIKDLLNSLNISPSGGPYLCTWKTKEKQASSFGTAGEGNEIQLRAVIFYSPLDSSKSAITLHPEKGSATYVPKKGVERVRELLSDKPSDTGDEVEIRVSKAEYVKTESGGIIIIKYKDTVFTFSPYNGFKFKF